MAAAENGALPRGKVGGIGDVVRDLPLALAELGWRSTVLIPEYGLFRDIDGAKEAGRIDVPFAGGMQRIQVIDLPSADPRVRYVALQHEMLASEVPSIYLDDGATRPFASDATKFALFCAAVASITARMDPAPDVVHLHDWHAALFCLVRAFDPNYASLAGVRTVFTIHNLALQGIRPLEGDVSSLGAWFPDLEGPHAAVADPRYPDCINPMAAAIRLADQVNTVSPTYANEITRRDAPDRGFRGGEGLEADLEQASADGRLVGILNGCEYPRRERHRPGWRRLMNTIAAEVSAWYSTATGATEIHDLALQRLDALPARRPANLLTSIGRLTDQKVTLFLQETGNGQTAIERILDELDGVFMLLGSGDSHLQDRFAAISTQHENFLFLCGYSETFSDLLYQSGDLFLMPSSFEPCGISQMLAMRAAQPCVVHAVGGLKDTVLHNVNGFSFAGASPVEQADQFVATTRHALKMKTQDTNRWLRIRDRAAAARFNWSTSAERYIEALYEWN